MIYLLFSPAFNINQIIITGNTQKTEEEILQISKIQEGDNIFKTIGIIKKVRLKQDGYIKDAVITKKFPNEIEINIVERTKDFQIETNTGVYIYIDNQGYIIDYSEEKLDLPIISGMDISEDCVKEQHRLQDTELDKMENILQIMQELLKTEKIENILKIDTDEEYIIELKSGVKINFGDLSDLKNKMYYMNAIMKKEEGHIGTIYLNGNINDGFLPYFKED